MKNAQLMVMTFFLLIVITRVCIYGQATRPAASKVETPMASLILAPNQHYLAEAGTDRPFFILADTAWNLDALTDDEITTYLKNRHSHHFNTIMFCLNFSPRQPPKTHTTRKPILARTQLNSIRITSPM